METVKEWRKGKVKKKTTTTKNTKAGGVVVAMCRWLETNYIQSQQTNPLLTEGRLKASNVKKSLTLWDEKVNVTDSE